MNDKSIFSKNLAKARDIKGWSQEDAAKELGITRRMLASYESGEAEPSHETQDKICQLYGITDLKGFITNEDYYKQLSPEELHKRYSGLSGSARKAIDALLGLR